MYKIGMFSKKTNTSIKTLRYYDEINLFKPEYCDHSLDTDIIKMNRLIQCF